MGNKGKLIGYARVSSVDQDLEIQIERLMAAGCDKIFAEKYTGTTTKGRDALGDALHFVREDDVLVVTRLDRLARSGADLYRIIDHLNTEGVGFRCLDQGAVDTTSSTGKLTLAILGAVAEFETAIRRERQREGIAKAKAHGIYKGRPPSIDPAQVRELREAGKGPAAIARELGISRPSVYRLLAQPMRSDA